MNAPAAHRHADDHHANAHLTGAHLTNAGKPSSSQRRGWAYPPRSLLCVGVGVRLSVAALATTLLWLTVLWALN